MPHQSVIDRILQLSNQVNNLCFVSKISCDNLLQTHRTFSKIILSSLHFFFSLFETNISIRIKIIFVSNKNVRENSKLRLDRHYFTAFHSFPLSIYLTSFSHPRVSSSKCHDSMIA